MSLNNFPFSAQADHIPLCRWRSHLVEIMYFMAKRECENFFDFEVDEFGPV